MSNKVVLGLGGNIGDVKSTLQKCLQLVETKIGKVEVKSSLYKTKAWGVENQPDFLNQAIVVNTTLDCYKILKYCMQIEAELGRERFQKWHERTIDIDILFFNEEIVKEKDIEVPHPFIQERNFVLFPLVEIIPEFIHPIFNKTIQKLKNSCEDELVVTKL